MEMLSCITYECMDIEYEIFFRYVNSVSRLCLHLRDTALQLNLPFDMCIVEGDDVEVVHEVLVRRHRLLTSKPLLRP